MSASKFDVTKDTLDRMGRCYYGLLLQLIDELYQEDLERLNSARLTLDKAVQVMEVEVDFLKIKAVDQIQQKALGVPLVRAMRYAVEMGALCDHEKVDASGLDLQVANRFCDFVERDVEANKILAELRAMKTTLVEQVCNNLTSVYPVWVKMRDDMLRSLDPVRAMAPDSLAGMLIQKRQVLEEVYPEVWIDAEMQKAIIEYYLRYSVGRNVEKMDVFLKQLADLMRQALEEAPEEEIDSRQREAITAAIELAESHSFVKPVQK